MSEWKWKTTADEMPPKDTPLYFWHPEFRAPMYGHFDSATADFWFTCIGYEAWESGLNWNYLNSKDPLTPTHWCLLPGAPE